MTPLSYQDSTPIEYDDPPSRRLSSGQLWRLCHLVFTIISIFLSLLCIFMNQGSHPYASATFSPLCIQSYFTKLTKCYGTGPDCASMLPPVFTVIVYYACQQTSDVNDTIVKALNHHLQELELTIEPNVQCSTIPELALDLKSAPFLLLRNLGSEPVATFTRSELIRILSDRAFSDLSDLESVQRVMLQSSVTLPRFIVDEKFALFQRRMFSTSVIVFDPTRYFISKLGSFDAISAPQGKVYYPAILSEWSYTSIRSERFWFWTSVPSVIVTSDHAWLQLDACYREVQAYGDA